LALNSIGGEITQQMARVLAPGGTMVTIGGMSKLQSLLPYDLIAARRLKMRGFWLDSWYRKHRPEDKAALLADVARLVREKKLTLFYELHDFDDYAHALNKALEPGLSAKFRKVLLNIDHPDRLAEHDSRKDVDYKVFDVGIV
jgi:trans-2-enoyl-CoA reductase